MSLQNRQIHPDVSHVITFNGMLLTEQQSLVETARRLKGEEKKVDKENFTACLKHLRNRTKLLKDKQAKLQYSRWAESTKYFEQERWKNAKDIVNGLEKEDKPAKRLKALKDQINIRVKGYGWTQFKVPFSSKNDPTIGSEDYLTKHLESIIATEKKEKLKRPGESPLPVSRTTSLPVMGTLSSFASKLKKQGWTKEELQQYQAEVEEEERQKVRREHDEYALDQPDDCGAIDQSLVGCHIEVMCLIETEVENEKGETSLEESKQWLPGEITQFAAEDTKVTTSDSKKRKRTKTIKKGFFLVDYDDGEVEWKKITEDNFNNIAAGSWRFDLDYGQRGEGPLIGAERDDDDDVDLMEEDQEEEEGDEMEEEEADGDDPLYISENEEDEVVDECTDFD
mmetsp:Transcript_41610/g.53671  ORF Transcript_41610/g.53671 Transcript_41610/m.53671 type:complete len:396 (-) Transcript_41610:300-1487(-)